MTTVYLVDTAGAMTFALAISRTQKIRNVCAIPWNACEILVLDMVLFSGVTLIYHDISWSFWRCGQQSRRVLAWSSWEEDQLFQQPIFSVWIAGMR